MTIELMLSIASFALSIGGLASIFLVNNKESNKNPVVLAVVIAALVPITGVTLYNQHQHESLVEHVRKEIGQKLLHQVWTFDQIFSELHYVSLPVVSEAIFRSVAKGTIGYKIIEFRDTEDGMQQVKGDYLQDTTN